MAKPRVPLKELTIPHLELVAAHMLSKFIIIVRRALNEITRTYENVAPLCYTGFTKQKHDQHM